MMSIIKSLLIVIYLSAHNCKIFDIIFIPELVLISLWYNTPYSEIELKILISVKIFMTLIDINQLKIDSESNKKIKKRRIVR